MAMKLLLAIRLLIDVLIIRRLKIIYAKIFSEGYKKGNFHGQTILITGAASGFGRKLALDFLKMDKNRAPANLILWDQNSLEEFENIQNFEDSNSTTAIAKIQIFTSKFDITDFSILKTKIEDYQNSQNNQNLQINVAILNAGIAGKGPFRQMSLEKYFKTIDINFTSNVHITKHLMEYHSASIKDIVYVSSVASYVNSGLGMSEYMPSKHAIRSFGECMAKEYKKCNPKTNFRVICPYFAATGILKGVPVKKIKNIPAMISIDDVTRSIFDMIYYDIHVMIVGYMGYVFKYWYYLSGADKRI